MAKKTTNADKIPTRMDFTDGSDEDRIVRGNLDELDEILVGEVTERAIIEEVVRHVSKSISDGAFLDTEFENEAIKKVEYIKEEHQIN